MPLAREQRKLAAIVAADVVGYSRLMGRDESGSAPGMDLPLLSGQPSMPAGVYFYQRCRRLRPHVLEVPNAAHSVCRADLGENAPEPTVTAPARL
jgi:hypothetical protein